MPWGAAAVVAGAAIGAYATSEASGEQADAAKQAASTQADANKYAADLQYKMYQEQKALQKPWQEAGVNALGKLTSGINTGQFGKVSPFSFTAQEFAKQQDPGYAFRLAEGNKALNQSAAARGGLISGNALKAAQRYGQDMGSQEFRNAYNRALTGYNANQEATQRAYNQLAGVSGTGQVTGQQIGVAGQNTANTIGNYGMVNAANQGNALLAQGNARASAYTGIGSAVGQGLQGLYQNRNTIGNWFSSSNNNSMPGVGYEDYSTSGNDNYFPGVNYGDQG